MKNQFEKNIIKPRSLRSKLISQLVIILVSTFIFYQVITIFAGITKYLDIYSYKIFENQTNDKTNQLKLKMSSAAININKRVDDINAEISRFQSDNKISWEKIDKNDELLNSLNEILYGKIVGLFTNETLYTGAFVYHNATYSQVNSDESMSAIYIKDSSPQSSSGNNSDLSYFRGPKQITESLDFQIQLDQNWAFNHNKGPDTEAPNQLFITRTMEAGKSKINENAANLGYWSSNFRHTSTDQMIFTYSVPIKEANGEIIGILGFEINAVHFMSQFSANDLFFNTGVFIFSSGNGELSDSLDLSPDNMIANGLQSTVITAPSSGTLHIEKMSSNLTDTDMYKFESEELLKSYVCVINDLNIYGKQSYFDGSKFYFIGTVQENQLTSVSRRSEQLLNITVILTYLLLAAALIFTNFKLSKSITNIADNVKNSDVTKAISLGRTKTRELDELSESFENMSANISTYAARMSDIIQMVGLPIGAFEENLQTENVFITQSLSEMLGLKSYNSNKSMSVSIDEWDLIVPEFKANKRKTAWQSKKGVKKEFQFDFERNNSWLRVKYIIEDNMIYGAVVDITNEIREMQKLEFEHNYDPLTKLLNRNSYKNKIEGKISANPLACGALIFGDLDNLKYVNDTYGHNAGDIYIKTTAQALTEFETHNSVVARIAGDEFVIYLPDGKSKEDLLVIINSVMINVRSKMAIVAPSVEERIKISIGVAFYPSDTDNLDSLVKYADFAMYEIKHTSKGGMRLFNRETFDRNSYIIHKMNFLDLFLDEKRLKFSFQPVINVKTREIYGYEALLRPQVREIQTPGMLFNLAKSQSKLYQVEKLILETILLWVSRHTEIIQNKMIFINSIANQILSEEDWVVLKGNYSHIMGNIIFEMTEQEYATEANLLKKIQMFRSVGSTIALDDYGSGYSNDVALLSIKPDIIKVDMAIIRDIDKDVARQHILAGIVDYAKNNNAEIIAEGVETENEVDAVIRLGVDYIQGFYVGIPNFELFEPLQEAKAKIEEYYNKHNK